MSAQERPSWAARLEADCDEVGISPLDVARAWVDATQRGYTLLDQDMRRFIGLGDSPNWPDENSDPGWPVRISATLELIGADTRGGLYTLEDPRLEPFFEAVSAGRIEVIRVDDDHVAYFGHPMAEFPGLKGGEK